MASSKLLTSIGRAIGNNSLATFAAPVTAPVTEPETAPVKALRGPVAEPVTAPVTAPGTEPATAPVTARRGPVAVASSKLPTKFKFVNVPPWMTPAMPPVVAASKLLTKFDVVQVALMVLLCFSKHRST